MLILLLKILKNATIFLIIFFCLFGISGDKIHNVLWRVCNVALTKLVEHVIIHRDTNKLGQNSPLKITERLINII